MSDKTKMLITRILVLVLLATSAILGGFVVKKNQDLKTLNGQIETLHNINNSYEDVIKQLIQADKIEQLETVTLTVVELDNSEKIFEVYVIANISIFDFLLLNGYKTTDFDSYDGVNYYFKDSMTDVNELKDNTDYYETSEWDGVTFVSLIVGLQDIIIDQNLTVVRSGF